MVLKNYFEGNNIILLVINDQDSSHSSILNLKNLINTQSLRTPFLISHFHLNRLNGIKMGWNHRMESLGEDISSLSIYYDCSELLLCEIPEFMGLNSLRQPNVKAGYRLSEILKDPGISSISSSDRCIH